MFEHLQYPFMQRALVIGVLIAASTAVIGVYLVLQQLSLIGDGLAHASFGGVALGFLLGFDPLLGALGAAAVASLGINRLIRTTRTYGDAAIALTYSAGMAVAIILIGYSGGFNADLFSYLFGSILAVSTLDLVLAGTVTATVIGFVWYFYDDLLQMTFNTELAALHGANPAVVRYGMTILVALAVVTAIRAVGILLVTALIVIPALTALQVVSSFRTAVLGAVAVSVSATVTGIFLAFAFDLPPSGVIVTTMLGMFTVAAAIDR